MGALVDFRTQKWRAQKDDLIGGWCVTPAADKRTPAAGAPSLADFCTEEMAQHVAEIHNNWLEDTGEKK
ncbi:hypothetical protein ACIRLA_29010 [Streptomyces sp. NPDC102364]|uniref:hypothetical protein n=1 Tax=Streptomyces sp. NPDC102364 TaxID=3366161 RepID=UPI003806A361